MSMQDLAIKEFVKELSSKNAVPGGGGASALCAALGASLGMMVGNLTVGKAKYAANEPELIILMDEAEKLRDRLLHLIDDDAEAFAPLAKAYAIPKDAPDRDSVMEQCLAAAAAVPLEILELSCKVIELQEGFSKLGSRIAVSDAGTGAVLAWSAMYGAALNVLVNTKSMKNREKAKEMNDRVNDLMEQYWKRADKVYEDVFNMMK